MAIYRGTGGSGNSTDDSIVSAVTEQAGIATTKAGEAATSATTATTKASEASASATTATNKANEAAGSATTAEGNKDLCVELRGEVFGLAQDALASANAAEASAQTANNSSVQTVAGISTEVQNVNNIRTEIQNVDTIKTDVTTVAGISSNVTTVAADASDIGTVATNIANVNNVGDNIANVNAVHSNASNINTVAADASDIGTVSSNISNVNTVAGISSDVTTVAGLESKMDTVIADASDIGAVANNIGDVSTVAGINSEVDTVAGISAKVTTVADNITDVQNADTNAANASASASQAANSASAAGASATTASTKATEASNSATAASNSATTATTKATEAAGSATTATTKATEASTSATNAATSATTATTKASEAASSATAASGSATTATTKASEASVSAALAATSATDASNAEDAWSSFYATYLGSYSAPPTVDVQGNALQTGAFYYDTGAGSNTVGLYVYNGSSWVYSTNYNNVTAPYSLAQNLATNGYHIMFGDNAMAKFGASNDLEIFHNSSNGQSIIRETGSGDLSLHTNGSQVNFYDSLNSNQLAEFKTGAECSLRYNGSKKFQTTSTGIDVIGKITADDELKITASSGYGRIEVGGTSGGFLDLKSPDSDDYDVRLITDGSGGILNVASGEFVIQQGGSQKLATTSTGIDVTGTVTADGFQTDTSNTNYNLLARNSANVAAYIQNGGTGDVLQARSGNMAAGQGDLHLKVANNGDISFYEDTGTTPKFFWDASAERLGIGTSSPAANLHVSSSGDTIARITSADGNGAFLDLGDASDPDGGRIVYDSGSNLALYTSSSERMRIDSSGNVGIGTTSPSSILDLGSNTNTSQEITISGGRARFGYDTAKGTSGAVVIQGSANKAIHFENTADTSAMVIDSSGNVGIGTTSPSSMLHVKNNTGVKLSDSASARHLNLTPALSDGTPAIVESTSANGLRLNASGTNAELQIYSNNTERMRIDSSGRVGIGTTSPQGLLDVAGAINGDSFNISDGTETTSIPSTADRISFSGASFNYIQTSTHLQVQPQGDLVLFGTGSEIMRLKSGNVGIGTSSPVSIGGHTGVLTLHGDNATAIVLKDNVSRKDIRLDDGNLSVRNSAGDAHLMVTNGGNVGIGTTSPAEPLHVFKQLHSAPLLLEVENDGYLSGASAGIKLTAKTTSGGSGYFQLENYQNNFRVLDDGTERMRIDASGNVLVGTTNNSPVGNNDSHGIALLANGSGQFSRDGGTALLVNRKTSDGELLRFNKDSTSVGSIGIQSSGFYIDGEASHLGLRFGSGSIVPRLNGSDSDNTADLGESGLRFKDLYRSGSTYSTSDRNKKQDIRDLTDAEARVAVVAKGSLKAFRYIDTVEAEGDDANIHFGIIAQDLKAAFEAEGLNADSYQVLKTTTYTDDDGVEQTTYSVCYENLLAFIISAI